MVMNLHVPYKEWKFLSTYMTVTFLYQLVRVGSLVLTLREEHWLRVYEKTVLRRIS
jgi:hypothetical protein